MIIGYSLGADVLPFMVNRLAREVLDHLQVIALLGPGHRVDFEFHLTDWLGGFSRKGSLSVLPEVAKLEGMKILCFYGEEETDSLCKDLDIGLGKNILLRGGHHFGGDYEAIAETILREVK